MPTAYLQKSIQKQRIIRYTQKEAVDYAIGLFNNGTIQEIQFIGKDGKEL